MADTVDSMYFIRGVHGCVDGLALLASNWLDEHVAEYNPSEKDEMMRARRAFQEDHCTSTGVDINNLEENIKITVDLAGLCFSAIFMGRYSSESADEPVHSKKRKRNADPASKNKRFKTRSSTQLY